MRSRASVNILTSFKGSGGVSCRPCALACVGRAKPKGSDRKSVATLEADNNFLAEKRGDNDEAKFIAKS